MATHKRRIYVDTSVFGAAFAPGFAEASNRLLDEVRGGRVEAVISGTVRAEIAPAPEHVRNLFAEIVALAEVAEPTDEALQLRDAYLAAGVVTSKWEADALHVALATVAGCSAIVSWNFKHIVHLEKAPAYNGVNLARGYHQLAICTPPEVVQYEDEDDDQ